jgi:WD40 repeat protein
MPGTSARKVTIFVSSPGDVVAERGRVQAVVTKLNREYEGLVQFETVLWEAQFYTADRSFQPQIPESATCDIVVAIFWTRIGTRLPAGFADMPNGKPYPSGTAYELLTALDASKAKGIPDVYVFRKTADATFPTSDAERRRQAQAQLEALEAFWSEWFKADSGDFKAAFQSFPTTDTFEQQIEVLLRQWLETHGLLGPRIKWPKEKGSPFRGLAAFEAEHAAVFFGRDRAIDEARRRLVAAADRGTPFLLMVGASGAGKSSLARAGVIPRLTTPGMVPSVDLWRVARMKPGEGQAGPLMALTAALFSAVPELARGDFQNAALLADSLESGSVQPIISALTRVAEDAQRERHADELPTSAIVLLVDQLEELFAQAISDPERVAFAETLRQLVATGRVWMIATLRADLYELLLQQPALKALKESGAALDLAPPGLDELSDIVRHPVRAAGVVFEIDAVKGDLADRLLADTRTADSLPLLQFTLHQLYERREEIAGEVRLTHAAYETLGGLAGAIAAEAERALAGLSPEAAATLPRLLRRLAEPARDGKSLTMREASRAELTPDPAEAALVDALVKAFILIARTDAAGRPAVRLAHDHVLTWWPRAHEAAQASREFYRVRAEIEDAQRRWRDNGRPKDRLIAVGVPLAEAEKLVADFGAELPDDLLAYVAASRNQARARQRLVASVAVFFFMLAVAATAAGTWAYLAQQRALFAQKESEGRQLNLLAELAVGEQLRGNLDTALRLATRAAHQALAMDRHGPAVSAPGAALAAAVSESDWRLMLSGHRGSVRSAAFSPDGTRVLTTSAGENAYIWDTSTGRQIAALGGPWEQVESAAFSPDGSRILGAILTAEKPYVGLWVPRGARIFDATTGEQIAVLDGDAPAFSPDGSHIVTVLRDKTARVWSATGKPVAVLRGHEDRITSAAFSPDGSRVVTASEDHTVRIWDAKTGMEIAEQSGVGSAMFSPDGSRILTTSGRISDAKTGTEIAVLRGYDGGRISPHFSPDGSRIVTASDNFARVWDAGTGNEIAILRGHERPVMSAVFSPDGSRVLTASEDKTVRIWDSATGKELSVLRGHNGMVYEATFSRDGSRIVTASYDSTARIWNVATGKEIALMHAADAWSAFPAISSDGSRILTTSADKTAQLWDAATGNVIAVLRGHESWVWFVVSSPDDSRIATASEDTTARIWDAKTGTEIAVLRGHEGGVNSVAFSPDGLRVVTASRDKTARIWDAKSGAALALLRGHESGVNSAVFSPDGSRVVTASFDKTARIWDAQTGAEIVVLRFAGDSGAGILNFANFSPDGTRIVTVNGGARFWHKEDELRVVSSLGTARVWDTATGKQIAALPSPVQSAVFSPNGTRIVTTSRDSTARIWDANSGVEIIAIRGHEREANSAVFSPDGSRVVTGSADKTARIWDAVTGKEVSVMRGHESSVISVAFSPDGSRIVTSDFTTVRIWDVHFAMMSTKELVVEVCARRLRGETKLSRNEMRLAGYGDNTPEIDVCAGVE